MSRYSCCNAHGPAFPHAAAWRASIGTPVMQMLDWGRCPLCPEVPMSHPQGDLEPAPDEDTYACACCGSRWSTTPEDDLIWECGDGCVDLESPWSALGGRTMTMRLQMAFSATVSGTAALRVGPHEPVVHLQAGPAPLFMREPR